MTDSPHFNLKYFQAEILSQERRNCYVNFQPGLMGSNGMEIISPWQR